MADPCGDLERDSELVAAVLQGREIAIHEFADRLHCVSRILGAQNAKLGWPLSEHDLADAVQDTIVIILTRLREFSATGPLEAWIYRVCTLEFMNVLRRRRRRRTGELVEDAMVDVAADRQQRAAVEREAIVGALAEVVAEEAEVVWLKYFEGLTFVEMQTRLGISANTLKARFYRGMQKLERLLGAAGAEAGER